MTSTNEWNAGTPVTPVAESAIQQYFIATEDQTAFTLSLFTYTSGTGSLFVSKNGDILVSGLDYTERVAGTGFDLVPSQAAEVNDIILAWGFPDVAGVVPTNNVIYTTVAIANSAPLIPLPFTYTLGGASLRFLVNGLEWVLGVDYTEASTTSVQCISSLEIGDRLVFRAAII
jgi:hypothetical protein